MRDSILMILVASMMILYASQSIAGNEKEYRICYKVTAKSSLQCDKETYTLEGAIKAIKHLSTTTKYVNFEIKEA